MENKCPLCNSTKTDLFWRGKGVMNDSDLGISYACANNLKFKPTLFKCSECNHLYSDKSLWPSESGEDYAQVVDLNYLGLEKVKAKTFERSAIIANQYFSNPRRMIEIGSYTGIFMGAMRLKGWDCVGVEPSRWAAGVSLSKGLKVYNGTLDQVVGREYLEPVELVVSWDVLEHVINPQEFIRDVSKLVAENGILILSTLDRTNYFARITGRHWPWIVNMHLHYFDQKTVIDLVTQFGFNLVSTKPHVHYASISYMLEKLFGERRVKKILKAKGIFSRVILPIGFGDVRYYVFKRN
jgi:hypothetical protein